MGPFPHPFHATLKPAGAACNLACAYCFYADPLGDPGQAMMSPATLDRTLARIFQAHPDGTVTLTWQGGEPTLRGLGFYRRAFARARELARPGQRVTHGFQTNGLLLDRDWARLFREHGVLVGLSCDGPPALHDQNRTDRSGRPSSGRVLQAWRLLAAGGVDTNLLCTVNGANVDHPLATYRYFRDELGATNLQFIPLVRAGDGGEGPGTGYPNRLGRFLIGVYDEWVTRDVGIVSVQGFEATLATVLGLPSLCVFARECGGCPVVERDGSLRACDPFADAAHRLEAFGDLRAFGRLKADLPQTCLPCEVLEFCRGGCPAGRSPTGVHWLCAAWKAYFLRVREDMGWMARQLRAGGRPDRIMGSPH